MKIGKIITKIRKVFRLKISYDDSYLNEDMNPDEIRKNTMKYINKSKSNK